MLITINTDASFNWELKIGAYAFWIVCDAGKIMHSGAFKNKVANSAQAEMMSIANALKTLAKSNFSGVTKIIINTDFLHYHGYVRNGNSKRDAAVRVLMQVQSELIKKYSLKKNWLQVRHVKAHAGTDEKRKWVNDWCDEQAKKWLKELVNKKA